jgi:hypothetical protein
MGIEKTLEAWHPATCSSTWWTPGLGWHPIEHRWLSQAGRTIVAMNKIDLLEGEPVFEPGYETVPVLSQARYRGPGSHGGHGPGVLQDQPRVFLDRHILLLKKAGRNLDSCLSAAREGLTLDVMAMDIRQAAHELSQMTGGDLDRDILEQVFSRFCVGK